MKKFIEELSRFDPDRGTVLSIGVFDGVHLGHQHLIRHMVKCAKDRGWLSGVITFHPNPGAVLHPETEIEHITDLEGRIELIKGLGVDLVIPVTFTLDLSRLSAGEFIGFLVERLRMKGLVVGPDFALGRGREGTTEILRTLGEKMGFFLEVVPRLDKGGQPVRSSAIRAALAEGDVFKVRSLLGRPFSLAGLVVRGAERGRTLGFPTCNLAFEPHRAIPADGIYATLAYVNGQRYQSATYVGTKPTFGEGKRTIEVYLLDFNGELYGQEMKVEWVAWLRGDMKFDSPQSLAAQIERDIAQARAILENEIARD